MAPFIGSRSAIKRGQFILFGLLCYNTSNIKQYKAAPGTGGGFIELFAMSERMAKKATKIEMQKRVTKVLDLVLSDMPTVQICQYAAEEWGVSRRSCERYLTEAKKELDKLAHNLRTDAVNRHLAQRAYLRREAIDEGDYRLAHDILKDEGKLLDIYPGGEGSSEDKPIHVAVVKGVSFDDI